MMYVMRNLLVIVLGASLAACAVPSARRTATPQVTTAPQTSASPADTLIPSVLAEVPDDGGAAPEPASQALHKHTPKRIVRVQLADNQQKAAVKHSGRVYVYTQNLDKKYKLSSSGTLSAVMKSNGRVAVGSLVSDQPVIIEPDDGTLLTWNDNVYSGKIFIVPAQYTFLLVEHVDLENYLYGVLPYEMSYSWPLEALKAQAVAARTYTLKTLSASKNKYFDLYSDVRSQMYKGGGKQYDSVRTAVDATQDQVLTFNGALFYTYYHGNCGGGTDDVRSWSPSAKTIAPLAGAACGYDTHSKSYTFSQNIPAGKVLAYAKSVSLTGKLKSIKVSKPTRTGRATMLLLQTSKGSKLVSCPKFRLATGLRSCKLTKITVQGATVRFEGRGFGHGVGMCQDGANGMAKAGKKYDQILKNYYPGAKITVLH